MELIIEKLIFEGYGLGHDRDGKAVFVRKSVPGDIVEVEIIKDKKNFKEGIIKKIIEPSKQRITAKCLHFEICGGCEHQNISYVDQLKFKEQIFREVLERAKIETEILPIIQGSEHEFYYRNTQRFFCNVDDNGDLIYQMHDFTRYSKLIEIKSCLLQSEFCNQFLRELANFYRLNCHSYPANCHSCAMPAGRQEGRNPEELNISQIRIREGKFTGEYMIELYTKNETLSQKDQLITFLKQFPEIKSAYHCVTNSRRIENAKRRLLSGSPIIHEKIGKFTFQISPDSFFQTNSLGIKTLYDKIKEFAGIEIGDSVLDLFCGTGTIGIYLSVLAKKVTGIELVQNAVNDAKANARINNITNCEFICADVEEWLEQSSHETVKPLTIIVDPPRQGLSKKTIFLLSTLDFLRLVYVSCNPATFARDIKEFEKYGLKLKKVQPVDMFPQTHHIECVGLVKKSNSQNDDYSE